MRYVEQRGRESVEEKRAAFARRFGDRFEPHSESTE
jgi:hypothetical protein